VRRPATGGHSGISNMQTGSNPSTPSGPVFDKNLICFLPDTDLQSSLRLLNWPPVCPGGLFVLLRSGWLQTRPGRDFRYGVVCGQSAFGCTTGKAVIPLSTERADCRLTGSD